MRRGLVLLVGLALLVAAVAPAAFASSEKAQPQPRQSQVPTEVPGLRELPNLPVASIALRAGQQAHHRDFRQGPKPKCDKDIDTSSSISGVTFVAAQDNVICTSADIDVYQTSSDSYVVQAGGEEAAWTHTRVTTPSSPVKDGQFKWAGRGGKNTYTPDVKVFRQAGKDYLALSLERLSLSGFCGVVIVDVTDPANPAVATQIYKNDSNDFWCDVHNSFVENVAGEGRYIYLTADARNDMRVVDIQNVASLPNPCDIAAGCNIEVGRYTAPTANSDNYVHDVTVIDHGGVGRRAYLAYWDSGLVVLNAADVTPGTNPTPLVGPNVIDPPGFLTHHAYPNAAGTRVFIEDEITYTAAFEPVQMWNISDTANPSYVAGITPDVGKNGELLPAHNLHVDASTLYVGWYKGGLQAFDFTDTTLTRTAYHQVQTENSDDDYDGAWGVRLQQIGGQTYVFQSDRRYGLIINQKS